MSHTVLISDCMQHNRCD